MCSKCDEIDLVIARYRWLIQQVDDQLVHEAAFHLVLELEAKKLALHPEE